ncbi:MAG: HupE/UreJ family protein [Nitratireductor sp.]
MGGISGGARNLDAAGRLSAGHDFWRHDGIAGIPLPHVETGIALSAIVLGICVATAFRPPLWLAAALVGAFAIFHGHAHGAELPTAVNPMAFSAGFVVATGLPHLCGIGFGLLARSQSGVLLVRAAGAAIAAGGVYFLAA